MILALIFKSLVLPLTPKGERSARQVEMVLENKMLTL